MAALFSRFALIAGNSVRLGACSESILAAPQRRWKSKRAIPDVIEEEEEEEENQDQQAEEDPDVTRMKSSQTFENMRSCLLDQVLDYQRFKYFAEIAEISGDYSVARAFNDAAAGESRRATLTIDLFDGLGDPVTDMPFQDSVEALEAAIASQRGVLENLNTAAQTAREEGYEREAEHFEDFGLSAQRQLKLFEQILDSHLQELEQDNNGSDEDE